MPVQLELTETSNTWLVKNGTGDQEQQRPIDGSQVGVSESLYGSYSKQVPADICVSEHHVEMPPELHSLG